MFVRKQKESTPKSHEWQERYIEAINMSTDTPNEALERARVIHNVQTQFIETAGNIVKVIVNESHLPNEEKTIAVANVGGIAGGDKYIKNGIMFKYAVDSKNIYGSDAFAAKAAGAEMRALRCISAMSQLEAQKIRREIKDNSVEIEPDVVNTPISTVVDYMGQRLICSALIPIGDETLIYGSKDAGRTIHFDQRAHDSIQNFAKHFNLASHRVFDKTKKLEFSLYNRC